MNPPTYAHSLPGQPPEKWQKLEDHLETVAEKSKQFAAKAGLPEMGKLIGLLHDLGKYSQAFQAYMKVANGVDVLDDDEGITTYAMSRKVDHSSAGGQFIWRDMEDPDPARRLVAQMMAICIVSHHSGLIDSISPNGDAPFALRMDKSSERTHVDEIELKMAPEIRKQIFDLDRDPSIPNSLCRAVSALLKQRQSMETGEFAIGLLVRFLLSALIDADRLDAANFERHAQSVACFAGSYPDWAILVKKLEDHLTRLPTIGKINGIRANISVQCQDFAVQDKGLFKLTVPTGGGKTLASLRFALHHAAHHRMDRIIYVIPYTSIIDQNAAVVRSILEVKGASLDNGRPVVLEYHSNLTPERDTRQSKILAENWDAPVVFTTAVQFLETLFASGTRGARRMHQLANTAIIFDEIQTIPIKMVHLFNNAINFLVGHCGTTAVFCTATQPLLDKVDINKGSVVFSQDHEIVPDVKEQFRALRRVEVIDGRKGEGWTVEEVADRACKEMKKARSVLVIVNTKAAAHDLYVRCKQKQKNVFHLSTSMCPAHRRVVLRSVKQCLKPGKSKPVICVSTQLIEAGVDIDFGCVIRHLAGLDSIAQASGRCNRNGLRETGRVLVVNSARENLDRLPEIRIAGEKAARVLDEYKANPNEFDNDLIGPEAVSRFYRYYFYERASEMTYPVSGDEIGRNDTLLSLLSTNVLSVDAYKRKHKKAPDVSLRQAFKTAATAFSALDAPTEGVLVPYGRKGARIIGKLCAAFKVEKRCDLLKLAQRYSVNVFPSAMRKLREKDCVREVQEGTGIMYLDERYYSREFGVSFEQVEELRTLFG